MRGGILRGPASVVSPGIWKAAGGPQARQTQGAAKFAHHDPSSGISAKKLPQHAPKRPFWNIFAAPGELFRAHAPAPGRAGRTFSRAGHSHVAMMQPMTPLQPLMQASVKPPSPMLAPEQQPLKPTTPMQPKNAPKTPSSRLQRRHRFQLGLGRRPQRRCRFQTSGPSGLQDPDAIPVGGCGARGRWRVLGFPKSRMQFDWMKIQ